MPPAARLTDMHTCPKRTFHVPHVGGPIISPGAPSVLIESRPAARIGDMCICNGPPDSIVQGCSSVLIGGKMAARMGDRTAHGGVIIQGAATVQIGLSAQSAALAGAAGSGAPFAENCP